MNNTVISNSVRFILLLLLQVLIVNHLNLFGFINPYIYIVWVVLFPIKKNKFSIILTSFLLGIIIDLFSDSGGINTASILIIAFYRLPILKAVLRKSDFDYLLFNLRSIPFGKVLIYITSLTIIHHFVLFSLVYFSFNDIKEILFNTISTSVFTVLLCIFGIVLFTKKK